MGNYTFIFAYIKFKIALKCQSQCSWSIHTCKLKKYKYFKSDQPANTETKHDTTSKLFVKFNVIIIKTYIP